MRCGCHVYRTTAVVVAAAIASPVGVTGSQQSSAPTAFVWGSNTFTVSWRPPVLLGTSDIVTKEQQPSAINTPPDKRNSRHSGSSSSSSSALKMNSHGDGKYNIRQCNGGGDYKQVIGSVDYWWGGRRMTPMLPRLFFEHFSETSFVAEMAQAEAVDEPAEIVGFVCGFVSPSLPKEAHVHFLGIDPAHRGVGLGSAMYKKFIDKMRIGGCDIVHAVTSPSNTASVAFHESLGFEALRVAGATDTPTDSPTNGPSSDTMDACLGAILFKTVLEGGADGTSRVLDEFVHVDWDGPDGGDRVLLQMNIYDET